MASLPVVETGPHRHTACRCSRWTHHSIERRHLLRRPARAPAASPLRGV